MKKNRRKKNAEEKLWANEIGFASSVIKQTEE